MFAHRYFAPRYFAPHYWAPAVEQSRPVVYQGHPPRLAEIAASISAGPVRVTARLSATARISAVLSAGGARQMVHMVDGDAEYHARRRRIRAEDELLMLM